MPRIIPVILCGGGGTRLRPLSTPEKPKQFLTLFGSHSLLQNTVLRLPVDMRQNTIFVTGERYLTLMNEQLNSIGLTNPNLVLEPEGRDSAPAIAIATALAQKIYGDDITLAVLPSDHYISPIEQFQLAVRHAAELAQDNGLVTFGITPACPATGYGYIERGAHLPDSGGFSVLRFVEKPDQATAIRYLNAGGFYWNSGMFVFTARDFAQEAALHMPELWHGAQAIISHNHIVNIITLPLQQFAVLPKISIDYALFEKSRRVCVFPVDFEWSDLGTIEAVEALRSRLMPHAPQIQSGRHQFLS